MGTAPALAESTAGVRPAGKTEKATTAKPEALIPWAQDKVVGGLERLPREGKYMHEPPPKALPPEGRCRPGAPPYREGKCEADTLPQGEPSHEVGTPWRKREREPGLSQEPSSRENVMSTWERPSPWDPGGMSLR